MASAELSVDRQDLEEPPMSSTSSHGDASSARYTPESDFEDETGLAGDIDGEDGIELERLVKRNSKGVASNRQHWSDDDDDEENHSDDEDGDYSPDPLAQSRRTSIQSFELYTPDEERRVKRKLDTRLVLFVALLYMLSFLDRSNIGNAKVAGLTRDLRLDDSQFEWLLTAFYISYIAFEWMTVMFQIVRPHVYISLCVGAWGILASCQALTTSWAGLMVIRALLGVGEAAFVGIPFYLTFFFRREELALRTGLFISAAPLATTFASSLAYAIMALGGRVGIASWRLLFLVEGFPAVLVAVWAWSWIPDSPGTAWWLTARERKVAVLRLRRDESPSRVTKEPLERHKRSFSFTEVGRTLRDPKAYLTAAMFFCCNVAFSSMPVFLPTIVNSMGFTAQSSQALSAPPFFVAFIVVLLTALISDRLKSRSVPLIMHTLLALSGYLFLTLAGALDLPLTTLRYLAVYPICAGFFSAVTLIITWTINNQSSDEGKGTGVALLNVIGQCGPLVGTRLYPDDDAPYFIRGMAVCAVAMGIAACLAAALRLLLVKENRRMASLNGNGKEGEVLVKARQSLKRDFVYIL